MKLLIKHKYKAKNKKFTKVLKALVDPGSSSSLVTETSVGNLPTYRSSKTSWETSAGSFLTNKKVDLNLKLSELSETALVNHQFNVRQGSLGDYDMIIGRDLTNSIGLDACGSDQTIKWPKMNAEVPYKQTGLNQAETYYIRDPDSLSGETDRMSCILDAKYSKADLYIP